MTNNRHTIEQELLHLLQNHDTPTICNALDIAAPQRPCNTGFTKQPVVPLRQTKQAMVGYARTAKISAITPVTAEEKRNMALQYYAYTAQGPHPTIIVIEDIDPEPGQGAHWGEVHTKLHQAFGALGAITNGSFRDLDDCAEGFQILGGAISPSHAYVHVVEYNCDVEVFGLNVKDGDLIHADKHGAVSIPTDAVQALPDAIQTIIKREKVILDAISAPDFTMATLTAAVLEAADIH